MFVLTLPVLGSLFGSENPTGPTPFAGVVYAGHQGPGAWCQCGCPGCICDPGEQATPCMENMTTQSNDPKGDDTSADSSARVPKSPDFDTGSGALLLALLFLMLRRMGF